MSVGSFVKAPEGYAAIVHDDVAHDKHAAFFVREHVKSGDPIRSADFLHLDLSPYDHSSKLICGGCGEMIHYVSITSKTASTRRIW